MAAVIPDYTTSQADIKRNRIGLQITLLMLFSGLTGSDLVLCGLKKPSVKADLLIYSSFVTVSGQCLSMVITKKWISIFGFFQIQSQMSRIKFIKYQDDDTK